MHSQYFFSCSSPGLIALLFITIDASLSLVFHIKHVWYYCKS